MLNTPATWLIWLIAALSVGAMILRPRHLPVAIWVVTGALALVACGLFPAAAAWQAVCAGSDVYLFLAGMMLLAELARREGLFEHLAAWAVQAASGSASRLFVLVYAIGVLVTVFMSNDATAVLLTPAVYAVARKARARPLPYLMACAMVANAASFVLPISNPANLVVFASHPPPLGEWLSRFALPSLCAVTATFVMLRFAFCHDLAQRIDVVAKPPPLAGGARAMAWGIAAVAGVLLLASALHAQLGAPTLLAAGAVASALWLGKRQSPWPALRSLSWSMLLLVAGLFVLVQAVAHTGVTAALAPALRDAAAVSPAQAAWRTGAAFALASNLLNNLPAGLLAASVLADAQAAQLLRSAVMIGIDLGPNLSVSGSLATLFWLDAIRREGGHVGALQFLKVGVLAMPSALLPALAVLLLQNSL